MPNKQTPFILGVVFGFALLFVLVGVAHCQGTAYHDIALGISTGNTAKALPFASVRVCTAAAAGTPCAPLANIYSNATLTTAKANPFQADAYGNYLFYAAPSHYLVQVSAATYATHSSIVFVPYDSVSMISTVSASILANANTWSGINTFNNYVRVGPYRTPMFYLNATPLDLLAITLELNNPAVGYHSSVRSRMDVQSGGVFNSSQQTSYWAFGADNRMAGRGQLQGYWVYNKSLGGGNAIGFTGVNECWGGSTYGSGGAEPQCTAFGESHSIQGSTSATGSVVRATVNGNPGADATVIPYNVLANEDKWGQRYVIFSGHTTSAVGGNITSISSYGCTVGAPCAFGGDLTRGTRTDVTFNALTTPTFDSTSLVPCDGHVAGQTCNPVGLYFHTGDTTSFTATPCLIDNMPIDNICVPHFFEVVGVKAGNVIVLENQYDSNQLVTSSPAYALDWGSEVQSFSTTAKTITIKANHYTLVNGNGIYSPPSPFMDIQGVYVLTTKRFKLTGSGAPSSGFTISNIGQRVDALLWLIADGTTVYGGAKDAFRVQNCVYCQVGINLNAQTFRDAAIKLNTGSKFRWSNDATGYDGPNGNVTSAGMTLFEPTGGALGIKNKTSNSSELSGQAQWWVFNRTDAAGTAYEAVGLVGADTYYTLGSYINGAGMLHRPMVYDFTYHQFRTGASANTEMFVINTNAIRTVDTSVYGWTPAADVDAAADTGFSRLGPGSVGVGNGVAGNTTGSVTASTFHGVADSADALTGFKHQRWIGALGGTCPTTGLAAGEVCTGAKLTWTTAFADTNYTVNCSFIDAVLGTPTILVIGKASDGVTITLISHSAAAADVGAAGTVDCIAKHDP